MRDHYAGWFAAVLLALAPGVFGAAPKPQEAYLVHPSTETVQRREAVLALARSKDAQAGVKLVEALKDKDPMTRTLAAQGLGSLKVAAALSSLANVLANDPYPEVRQAAATSLRQIGDPAAVDALGKAVGDVDPNVRLIALTGLGRYRDPSTRPLVEAACKDKSVEVRRTAVYVLGRLEDPAAVPTVEQLLKDPDAAVRAGAAQTLGDLHVSDSKTALLPLLNDPDHMIRASVARSLIMLGDNSGFDVAKALDHDPDLAVRVVAIDALGWSKDPAAETELQSLLTQTPAASQPAVQEALLRTQQLRKR